VAGVHQDGEDVVSDDLKVLQDAARAYLEAQRPAEGTPALSLERTPYAILCREHGQQFLTDDEYGRQLCRPDARWTCPKCGRVSDWDDDNYEAALGDE
jgi:hypothetical protein